MKHIKINIYKLLFIFILFTLTAVPVFEVHYLLFFISTALMLLTNNDRISKYTFDLLSALILIFIIGFISSFFQQKRIYDWIKDILYFSKPIIALTLGYLLVKKINDKNFFIRTIIFTAFIFTIYHISSVFINTNFATDSINDIRNTNGLDNPLELIALIILIASSRYGYIRVIRKRKMMLIIFLSFSVFLYFSRTMLISFIIMLLAILDYAKLTEKGLQYGVILLIVISSFYFYLFSTNFERDKAGIESFLYKIKIAPSEIFSATINTKEHKNLWDHWRAYESKTAYNQMKLHPTSFINGYGFGSLVDLKFVAPLNEHGMRYIPTLHNGYSYVLFKTGLLGLFFYLSFLILLYIQSYKNEISKNEKVIRNTISAIGLFFILSSLVISGIYNSIESYTLLLGGFLFLLEKVKNQKDK